MARKKNGKAKETSHRLNLALNGAAFDKLKMLEKETTAGSMTEVIGRALAIYEAIVQQKKEGGRILIEKGNKQRELWVL